MEYRLIRHQTRGLYLVAGSDGLVSAPLDAPWPLTSTGAPQPGWWRVPRPEYSTALWEHPLWTIVARHVSPGTYGRDSDGNYAAPGSDHVRFTTSASLSGEVDPPPPASAPELNATP